MMKGLKTLTHTVPTPSGLTKLAKSKDLPVKVANIREYIKVKTTGALAGKAFYLPKAYNWLHGVDEVGNEVLIPRKKTA
jgi:hypothetical protein